MAHTHASAREEADRGHSFYYDLFWWACGSHLFFAHMDLDKEYVPPIDVGAAAPTEPAEQEPSSSSKKDGAGQLRSDLDDDRRRSRLSYARGGGAEA